MSNITGDGGSFSSENNTGEEEVQQQHHVFYGQATATTNSSGSNSQQQQQQQQQQPPPIKKKRNLPGTPDPNAEVIALSPTTLLATNRFVCEICNKGFQRDQNLQLHRRGHNLPWKLRQRTSTEIRKRVYICPETTCVHHNPSRALGDLTGIKKHFCRKHGEKKWKCDKCSKKYAVQSDWKAHSKTCGTREYKCDCGTIFSRRDSFITHRAFCDALAEENSKPGMGANLHQAPAADLMMPANPSSLLIPDFGHDTKTPLPHDLMPMPLKSLAMPPAGGMFSTTSGALFGPRAAPSISSSLQLSASSEVGAAAGSAAAHMSATALLQKAAHMGATASGGGISSPMMQRVYVPTMAGIDMRGYNPMQGHAAQYEQPHQQQQESQTQLVGVDDGGGFPGQYLGAPLAEGPTMGDMGIFSATGGPYMGGSSGEQVHGFGKNMEHESSSSSTNNLVQARSGGRAGAARFGGGDVMTVDFLGVGGARSVVNLHGQRQQGVEYEGGMHPSYQQQMTQAIDKMWEI